MSTIKTGTTLTTAYSVTGDTTGTLVVQTGSTPTTAATFGADQVVTFAKQPAGTFAGTGPAFNAYASAAQAISASTTTKVVFDTERFDTASCYNNTGSTVGGVPAYSFLPSVAGYYQFNVNIYAGGGTMQNTIINIYKNGVLYSQPVYIASSYIMQSASDLIYLNGSTDYIGIYFANQNTCSVNTGAPGSSYVQFSGSMARAA